MHIAVTCFNSINKKILNVTKKIEILLQSKDIKLPKMNVVHQVNKHC